MDNQPLLQFLQSGGMINALLAQEIASSFSEKLLNKNEVFIREGQISNYYLILTNGFMRSFARDTEGTEVTTGFFPPVQPVFEVASFFLRQPSMENFQALEESSGWVIGFEELNRLFHTHAPFREFGRTILVKGFAAYKTRTLSMITQTAEQRYRNLMDTDPGILQKTPLKYLASYLGITDSSLSRIRKEVAANPLG